MTRTTHAAPASPRTWPGCRRDTSGKAGTSWLRRPVTVYSFCNSFLSAAVFQWRHGKDSSAHHPARRRLARPILIPSQPRPRWRAYRVAEYPTPEAVVRRCAAGLSRRGEDERHDDHDTDGNQKISQHGGPLRVRWKCWGQLV